MKRTLAVIAFALSLVGTAAAQVPEVLDSLYHKVEILVGESIDDDGNVVSLGYYPRHYYGVWHPEVGHINPEGSFAYYYTFGINDPRYYRDTLPFVPCKMKLWSLQQRMNEEKSEIDVKIFEDGSCESSTSIEDLKHFVNHMYLIINDDTFYVDKDKYSGKHLLVADINLITIPLTNKNEVVFNVDDILDISIISKPYYQSPSLRFAINDDHELWHSNPVSGGVWISWRIPLLVGTGYYYPEAPTDQVRQEKLQGVYYEYRILRDGDKEWKPIFPKDFVLGEVETKTNRFGGQSYFQRRRYFVTGLDPNGKYSFCIRTINPAGVSEALCNLDIVTPVPVKSAEIPKFVMLSQNYPNPFNPSTTIAYTLKHSGSVELAVYDLTGRIVSTLVDSVQPAGYHKARFNADNIPTGTYIYRLRVGSETLTRTMTLVR